MLKLRGGGVAVKRELFGAMEAHEQAGNNHPLGQEASAKMLWPPEHRIYLVSYSRQHRGMK